MNEVQLFFKVIISKYFARDTACRELCDVATRLFSSGEKLHQRAFQQYQTQEARDATYNHSEDAKRVEQERNWRLSLKQGDQLDAVKCTTVRGL